MHDRIASTYESYKRDADVRRRPIHYTEGDLVMVRLRPERYSPGVATKLHPCSAGPFLITWVVGANAYVLGIPFDWGITPTFNVSDLAPYHSPPSYLSPSQPSHSDHTLAVSEGASPGPLVHAPLRPETVKEVLGELTDFAGKDGTRRRFLVRWTGRPVTDDSWISEEELRRSPPEHFDAEMDTGASQLIGAELSPPREDDGDHSRQTTRSQPARQARADVRDPAFAYMP